jgi:methylated-DNA-protein-cysteine methyltransferase-like protein
MVFAAIRGGRSVSDSGAPGLYEQIYGLVALVPAGKVATYGDIATALGTCSARTVGYALNALPPGSEKEVPWQRIVNSKGGISTPGSDQRSLLEAEGVLFDERGCIPLRRFRWQGPGASEEAGDQEQMSLF